MEKFGAIVSFESTGVLKRKKIILYRQIKELEMEYDIGNLERKDFSNRRAELKREVSLIINKLKKIDAFLSIRSASPLIGPE